MKRLPRAIIAVALLLTIGCSSDDTARILRINAAKEQDRLLRNRVWDGYYTAALNHRYALRLAKEHPEEAKTAQLWRSLQSEWRPLRYHASPDAGRIERLEQQQDAIEEMENPALYDDALMCEVQAELDRFLGARK